MLYCPVYWLAFSNLYPRYLITCSKIDENWICVDDGDGAHSPIAPQAVDALVAIGYRAAMDPVMFTPTKKTRRYMTEKILAFDDVPLPGPRLEGDGGSFDKKCMLWTGRFQHR